MLLNSNVSQNRIAKILGINRKTVVRKFLFLRAQALLYQQRYLDSLKASGRLIQVQFDEMESFEHTKCKPLSIPLVVDAKTRKILGFGVCSMPAKGPLARLARQKYGKRADDRAKTASQLFSLLTNVIHPKAELTSDQNPKYPGWIRKHFPKIRHETVKGQRGCIVGQGELKKIGFDPLFSLNHTAAMLRANVNRLIRKTWCTTKRLDRLEAHIAIYVQYHNEVLTS